MYAPMRIWTKMIKSTATAKRKIVGFGSFHLAAREDHREEVEAAIVMVMQKKTNAREACDTEIKGGVK